MQIKNTKTQFGWGAIFLHWLMAILIMGMLGVGLYMVGLPVGAEKFKLYGMHKQIGMLVLMLVMIRIVWRLGNVTPSLSELPLWERLGARAAHWAFYILMFAMPITGWLMSSAAGFPVSFFGLFIVPVLIPPNEEQLLLFKEIHKWLAYGLIVVFFGHVGAALKHHFIDKDNILRRMLWAE